MTKHMAKKKVESLIKKHASNDRRFRREYPFLVCFIDEEKDIAECKVGFYRDKINAHIRTQNEIKSKAERIGSFWESQIGLFK
jgi:hypothetical protein